MKGVIGVEKGAVNSYIYALVRLVWRVYEYFVKFGT